MSIDNLPTQLAHLEQQLDRLLTLESDRVRRVALRPAQRRLTRQAVWPLVDLGWGGAVLLSCGGFLGDRPFDLRLALCAVVVLAGVVPLLVSSVQWLRLLSGLDWTGPVAAIQETLEQIRALRIRQFQGIILGSPLVGFCAFLLGLQWLLDRNGPPAVSVFERLPPHWVLANLIFGVLFAWLGRRLAGHLSQRFRHHPLWQSILEEISGTALASARHDLRQWTATPDAAPPSKGDRSI